MNRREFFRRVSVRAESLRPPWALSGQAFADACNGCGDCVAACPHAIIVLDAFNRPVVNFAAGGCSFCGECAGVCRRGAFFGRDAAERAWTLVARIDETCMETRGIACRACESACAAAAFSFRPGLGGRNRVRVSPDRCSGCGACVSVCPLGAIAIGRQSPQRIEENAA